MHPPTRAGSETKIAQDVVRHGLSEEEVAARVAARAEARAAGDFAKSDAVRAELAAKGIALMDGATGGVAWRPTVAVPLEV